MASQPVTTCPSCTRRNRVPAAAAGTPRCGHCHAPLPWIADCNDKDFVDVVERAPLPVLLDLWAPWCGPCRSVSPVLEQLARSYAGLIKLVKVNVDSAPATAQRFAVQAVPSPATIGGPWTRGGIRPDGLATHPKSHPVTGLLRRAGPSRPCSRYRREPRGSPEFVGALHPLAHDSWVSRPRGQDTRRWKPTGRLVRPAKMMCAFSAHPCTLTSGDCGSRQCWADEQPLLVAVHAIAITVPSSCRGLVLLAGGDRCRHHSALPGLR